MGDVVPRTGGLHVRRDRTHREGGEVDGLQAGGIGPTTEEGEGATLGGKEEAGVG